jgi:hexosaminidase
VDAVPPESETGRVFRGICVRIVAGKATPEDWQTAHDWLVLWRDNDAKLQPALGKSELTVELEPVSQSLKRTAEIGLAVLDSLHNGHAVGAAQQKEYLAALAEAEKPQAVLLQKAAPAVELLVKAMKAQ